MRRPLHAVLAGCCAAVALGCADGYPSEDAAPLNAAALDRAGLLQALHDLAEQPALRPRRSYRLDDACVLEVTVHRRVGGHQRTSAALPGAQVELRVDADSRRYDVLVRPLEAAAEGAAVPAEVLAGTRWVDAVAARSVLRHLQADCVSPPAA